MVFSTGPYTVLLDDSILITANMQPEAGFPGSHQLKSSVASKSRLKLATRAVLSADAGLLVLIWSTLNLLFPGTTNFRQRISRKGVVAGLRNLLSLGVWPIGIYCPNLVNFKPTSFQEQHFFRWWISRSIVDTTRRNLTALCV